MSCRSCHSANQSKFPAEISVHFSGFHGLEKPTVFVFPKLLICLNCGFTEFFVTDDELQKLKNFEPSDDGGGS